MASDSEDEPLCKICRDGTESGALFYPWIHSFCSSKLFTTMAEPFGINAMRGLWNIIPLYTEYVYFGREPIQVPNCSVNAILTFSGFTDLLCCLSTLVYAPDTPNSFSLAVFCAGLWSVFSKQLQLAARYLLIVTTWAFLVPLAISFIWHIYFPPTPLRESLSDLTSLSGAQIDLTSLSTAKDGALLAVHYFIFALDGIGGGIFPTSWVALLEDIVQGIFLGCAVFVGHMALSIIVEHVQSYITHRIIMLRAEREANRHGQANEDMPESDAEEEPVQDEDDADLANNAAAEPMDIETLLGFRGPITDILGNMLFVLRSVALTFAVAVILPHILGRLTHVLINAIARITPAETMTATLGNTTSTEQLYSTFQGGSVSLNDLASKTLYLARRVPAVCYGLAVFVGAAQLSSSKLVRFLVRVCCLFVLEIGVLPVLLGIVVRSALYDFFSPSFFVFSSHIIPQCAVPYAVGPTALCGLFDDPDSSMPSSLSAMVRLNLFGNFRMVLPEGLRTSFWLLSLWAIGFSTMLLWTRIMRSLRDELAPGVLWFIRFSDDSEFSLIKSFVEDSIFTQLQRFVKTFLFYSFSVLSFLWAPIHLVLFGCKLASWYLIPIVIPAGSALGPLDLLLLHYGLPMSADLVQLNFPLQLVLRTWLNGVLGALGLTHLLPGQQRPNPLPSTHVLRVIVAFLLGWACMTLIGTYFIFMPLVLGRLLLVTWSSSGIHEPLDLWHWLSGLYLTIISTKLVLRLLYSFRQHQGPFVNATSLLHALKVTPIAVVAFGCVPYLTGRLIETLLITPESMKEVSSSSPIWQAWLFGAIVMRIVIRTLTTEGIVSDGLRQQVKQLLDAGFGVNMRTSIVSRILLIAITSLLGAIYLPPLLGKAVLAILVDSGRVTNPVARRILELIALRASHFVLVFLITSAFMIQHLVASAASMYAKFRDERYLVTRQLQNLDAPAAQPQ